MELKSAISFSNGICYWQSTCSRLRSCYREEVITIPRPWKPWPIFRTKINFDSAQMTECINSVLSQWSACRGTSCTRKGADAPKLKRMRCTYAVQSSIDDEFRSSRSIALGIHRRYRQVVERGFSNNIIEFITAGVTAYAVGCTDEGLRRELVNIRDSDNDPDAISLMGGAAGVKCKLTSEEIEECILWLSIVFITILCTPQPTVVRWSSISPVSAEALMQWQGFCALIANAYYIRGMAWLPVKTLQLEQMAVMGRAEEPALVADRMRLVFATLETVSPQWPKG